MQDNEVISLLLSSEEVCRGTLPHLKGEYFSDEACKALFYIINGHYIKYNSVCNTKILQIELEGKQLPEPVYNKIVDTIKQMEIPPSVDGKWAIDKIEKYCQDRAIFNAIMKSIAIFNNEAKEPRSSIPDLLQQALSIGFNKNIGVDYTEDYKQRFEEYAKKTVKIPFDLEILNKITRGGVNKQTLNMFIGPTGSGKTHIMTHLAAGQYTMGYNVLYVTCEMSDIEILKRVDANLLDISLDDIDETPFDTLEQKLLAVKSRTIGKLVVQQYPTSSASSITIRNLLKELKLKKNFVPDIIYIDYLNILASARLKQAAAINSYLYVKAIAEEIRAIAVEFDVPIVSATQTNRGGFDNSDYGMKETSESAGVPMTLDLMLAIIRSEQLDKLNQIMLKILKTRYNDPGYYRRFVVGAARNKMRLFDCDQAAQEEIVDPDDFEQEEKPRITSRPRSSRDRYLSDL